MVPTRPDPARATIQRARACAGLPLLRPAALPAGLPVERDLHFMPEMTLADYASRARLAGRVH